MRKPLWVILWALAFLFAGFTGTGMTQAALSRSAVTGANQQEMSITIYNGNLGLVKDVREFQVAVGTHEVRFIDVASQIDPTTVHLKSLTWGTPAG